MRGEHTASLSSNEQTGGGGSRVCESNIWDGESFPVEETSESVFKNEEVEFKVRPVFGGDWLGDGDDHAALNFHPPWTKLRDKSDDAAPSSYSSAPSVPGEFRRTNQRLADFWEEKVGGYKRSISDGDKPADRSSFRPVNPTYYYYYPQSAREG